MPLIDVTRQPDTLQAYQLTTPQDMVTALAYLAQGNYTGHINCAVSGGSAVWTMGLTSPGNSASQSAVIGDWIVIRNNAIATVVTSDQFTSLYTTE